MEYDSTPSTSELPPWDRLMRAFLTLLQSEGPRTTGESVCDLFFGDPWFCELVERRAKQAVNAHAVPSSCRDDLEQEISLLFLQKADKTPDLHVNFDVVETHFGGWIWTIIDRLCAEAVQHLHRVYRFEGNVLDDIECSTRQHEQSKIDIGLLIARLPQMTQTILTLFDEGYTLKEIAELVDEPYWRVCGIYREAVAFLRDRLRD
ncbi:MAG: sigma-70 family RNA polymerase sigma factor [Pirellulales bacterium]